MSFCISMPSFHIDPLGRSGPRDPISETRAKELECGGGYVLNKEQKHNEFLSEVAKYRSDVADGVFPLYWKDKKNGIAIFSLMFDSVSERASLGRNAIGAMSVNQKTV